MSDPIPTLLLSLTIIILAGRAGGHVAARLGQPPVLGELLAGVAIGNLTLLGFSGLEYLKANEAVAMLAELGVILLLFQVGLEATVPQMLKVGLSSLLVGTLGVIGPFALGWAVGAWLLPAAGVYAHVFLGATLTATSVGITARVLKDLGRSQSDEARIILGAAVIDDVQGLIILAVVTGIITAANIGGAMSYAGIGIVVFKVAAFLFGALAAGVYLSPRLFALALRLQSSVLLALGLVWCFLLAWLASVIGLAPIVGAFAAGLLLEDQHDRDVAEGNGPTLHGLIDPLVSFLVPVFFVLMGIRTDLSVFAEPGVAGLAAALTVAAIVGKLLCSFGVIGEGLDRVSVGIGMIPRGEVGLIFANIGLTLIIAGRPVVTQSVFSAVVVMVILTTVIAPPALKWSFERRRVRNAS
jgi:Kef-type K+ transport system membrane component KefB